MPAAAGRVWERAVVDRVPVRAAVGGVAAVVVVAAGANAVPTSDQILRLGKVKAAANAGASFSPRRIVDYVRFGSEAGYC